MLAVAILCHTGDEPGSASLREAQTLFASIDKIEASTPPSSPAKMIVKKFAEIPVKSAAILRLSIKMNINYFHPTLTRSLESAPVGVEFRASTSK